MFPTSYSYGAADKEYIFSWKGRPFAALVSHNISTSNTSLVAYDLIKELGLKFSRILGHILKAVQCFQNGKIRGNFHIKGLVVTNLYQQPLCLTNLTQAQRTMTPRLSGCPWPPRSQPRSPPPSGCGYQAKSGPAQGSRRDRTSATQRSSGWMTTP